MRRVSATSRECSTFHITPLSRNLGPAPRMSGHACEALAPSARHDTRPPLVGRRRDRDGGLLLLPPASGVLLYAERARHDAHRGCAARCAEARFDPAAGGVVEPRRARPRGAAA